MAATPIEPELAALTPTSLTKFARRYMNHPDAMKREAAGLAYTDTLHGDYDRARRRLSRAGIVPEAPSLIPLQPSLFEDMR